MTQKPVLYGFDGSTYVRTVRIVLAEKGVEYEQVPVNVLEGEPRQPEHLARHPFGKVPVLDIDGMRLLETAAISEYLDESVDGGTPVRPADPKARARMRMAMGIIDSYGYGALVGAAGFHLFPDFLGNPSQADHDAAADQAELVLKTLMGIKGDDPWIAGSEPSLADYYLGPILFYVGLTPDADRLMAVPGVSDWWAGMSAHQTFKLTEPDLG